MNRHPQNRDDEDDSIDYYETSIFDFKVPTVNGSEVSLSKYKGKKVYLVVNVSSYGDTGLAHENYSQLQNLYEKYQQDLEILAFLSDDFTPQMEISSHQIARKAKARYYTDTLSLSRWPTPLTD
jgi:glutathione peroxidase